jgi:hypothetical protein
MPAAARHGSGLEPGLTHSYSKLMKNRGDCKQKAEETIRDSNVKRKFKERRFSRSCGLRLGLRPLLVLVALLTGVAFVSDDQIEVRYDVARQNAKCTSSIKSYIKVRSFDQEGECASSARDEDGMQRLIRNWDQR